MMPADLIYALSDEKQRAALNRAHAQRQALRDATRRTARVRPEASPSPAGRRRVFFRLRRTRECPS